MTNGVHQKMAHPLHVTSSHLGQWSCALPRLGVASAARQQAGFAVFFAHVEVVLARGHGQSGFEDFRGEVAA